ncbi:hypothetical protein BHE74_00028743 [Ensete ventricosum]|uniref:Uncharacterized protein n=1 Tax=Ensete ventricosum TaxID=4639 RepID=A0A427AQ49_ENSVE|nr:hypothetical protein B296_00027224 [Ensete ventricosum]RWW64046.1 hypothetical protein BHE74_00028743 [Ensete ventricosum]
MPYKDVRSQIAWARQRRRRVTCHAMLYLFCGDRMTSAQRSALEESRVRCFEMDIYFTGTIVISVVVLLE